MCRSPRGHRESQETTVTDTVRGQGMELGEDRTGTDRQTRNRMFNLCKRGQAMYFAELQFPHICNGFDPGVYLTE